MKTDNNQLRGVTPQDILPDNLDSKDINGVNVRKGSIAAVLANIDILESSTTSSSEKQLALNTIKELAPAMVALGLAHKVTWKNSQVEAIIQAACSEFTQKAQND